MTILIGIDILFIEFRLNLSNMQVNKEIDYSLILRALKDTYKSGEFVSLEAVAEAYNLPYSFLEKLAGKLKRAGVLNSQRQERRLSARVETKLASVGNIMDVFQDKPRQNAGLLFSRDLPVDKRNSKLTAVRKTLSKLTVNNL